MTRLPFALHVGHMYSRGWTKVVGDIMEAGGRTDVGGFQFHMCELRSTTGTLSSGLGRTDRSDDVQRPHENPLCGSVCATTKQQLRQRDNVSKSIKTAQPFACPSLVFWGLGTARRFADVDFWTRCCVQ